MTARTFTAAVFAIAGLLLLHLPSASIADEGDDNADQSGKQKADLNSGILLHFVPERAARPQRKQGGFTVSAPVPRIKLSPMSADAALRYIQTLAEEVRAKGVWVLYTHPHWYKAEEKQQLKKLIEGCNELGIPIHTCLLPELPKGGWKKDGPIE